MNYYVQNIKSNKPKKGFLMRLGAVLLIAYVVTQMYLLTTIGTKGEKISYLRRRQAEIKIENEIKRANILKLQSTNMMEDTISNFQMSSTPVIYLDQIDQTVSAQN